MENIVITWRELLVVVALVLAVYIAELLLLTRSSGGLLRKPRWLPILQQKQAEAAMLAETELRGELEQLRQRLQALEDRLQQQDEAAAAAGSLPGPYMHAIQMARQGRDAESLAAGCGISRAEAELIISMHGGKNFS